MLKIYIADDSIAIIYRLEDMLVELGDIELVGWAVDAEQAVEQIAAIRPDVAILDIRMPGNGLHALERIKELPNPPLVIVFTAYPFEQYRRRSQELGAEYFFDKAMEFGRIGEVLAEASRVKAIN
jgi:DNA-binding NarL/FixJ family response regulator